MDGSRDFLPLVACKESSERDSHQSGPTVYDEPQLQMVGLETAVDTPYARQL